MELTGSSKGALEKAIVSRKGTARRRGFERLAYDADRLSLPFALRFLLATDAEGVDADAAERVVERPRIFQTDAMHASREEAARANLARSLRRLGADSRES